MRLAPVDYDERRDGKKLTITELDGAAFRFLHTHPQAPATYLHVAMGKTMEAKTPKQIGVSHIIKSTTQRLSQLRNHGYLTRPKKQDAADNNKGQVCTYELDRRAREWLQARDLWSLYAAPFKGHPSHQFFLSCVSASIDLATRRCADIAFISKEDIFERATCPTKRLDLFVDGQKVIPDNLFGIRFLSPEKTQTLYFAVELERAEKSAKQYREKFSPYDAIIRQRIYKDAWGINNLRVLIPTVSKVRIELMKKQLEGLSAAGHFLFRAHGVIAEEWRVPPIMYDLFEGPWHTTVGEFYIDRPKA